MKKISIKGKRRPGSAWNRNLRILIKTQTKPWTAGIRVGKEDWTSLTLMIRFGYSPGFFFSNSLLLCWLLFLGGGFVSAYSETAIDPKVLWQWWTFSLVSLGPLFYRLFVLFPSFYRFLLVGEKVGCIGKMLRRGEYILLLFRWLVPWSMNRWRVHEEILAPFSSFKASLTRSCIRQMARTPAGIYCVEGRVTLVCQCDGIDWPSESNPHRSSVFFLLHISQVALSAWHQRQTQ